MWSRPVRWCKRAALLLPALLLTAVLLIFNSSPRAPSLALFISDNDNHLRLTEEPLKVEHDPLDYKVIPHRAEEPAHTSPRPPLPWYMRSGTVRPTYSDAPLPLFPEDAPDSDRIEEQLMYVLPENEDAPTKVILLPDGHREWSVGLDRAEFLKNRCPVDRCSITYNLNDAKTADAILFKNIVSHGFRSRSLKQIWILHYLESPYHTPSIDSVSRHNVNWTATYRRDSDIVTPYERWALYDRSRTMMPQERNYAANKTKKVAWFVSNCRPHNDRLHYAKELSEYIDVDIYGTCGSLECPRHDPNCLNMLKNDYKFYLAFENSNCKDYITEKYFVNGLSQDTIPIVMGPHPSDYDIVSPPKSFIHVEDFLGPKQLAEYLHVLDNDDRLYNEYFQWKGTGELINTFFFCRLCAMLHAADRQKVVKYYEDVDDWWHTDMCWSKRRGRL